MDLKRITWPSGQKVAYHFLIALVGIAVLIVFFICSDLIISFLFEKIYV